ncbi:MAG TPA: OsmC family protein [Candidatus Tectomicrobia bacterium]|nr:OsmC family protein [Candidatus Tectomicrobia bacterium]
MAIVGMNGRRSIGVDPAVVAAFEERLAHEPGSARVEFRVRAEWRGQMRTRASVDSYTVGGRTIHRHFTVDADQPFELLGRNTAPSPQELLLAAVTATLSAGYAAGAALRGIALERLEIEASTALDIRTAVALGPAAPDDRVVRCIVRVKGDGTPEQLREIHEAVSLAAPVRIDARLIVE